jgi:hypothetical protein
MKNNVYDSLQQVNRGKQNLLRVMFTVCLFAAVNDPTYAENWTDLASFRFR